MKRNVTDFALYRFRYVIGYLIILIAISSLLLFAGLYVPGGIRAAEVSSIVSSSELSFTEFNPDTVINLPYNLLQLASLAIFGVSIFSIKLTSMLLGILAIVGIYLLIREWFRKNIAVVTTLLALSMPIFLFMAQDGTPAIYASVISIWLLYAATLVSRRREPRLLWKILLFMLTALNLYTPLGIYVILAVASTVIFHPHVRHTVKSFNSTRIVTGSAAFATLLIPLIYSLAMKPTLALSLIGIPSTMPNLAENAATVGNSLFGITGGSTLGFMHPVISLGIIVIILIGIHRFFLIKYTARSYIIWFWSALLIPFIILNPVHLPYLYPLIVIMTAMGINTIISTWYKTFPKNPYARVVGLIPLSVIVIGLSVLGVNSYALSYTYDPDLRQQYSEDIRLMTKVQRDLGQDTTTVVIGESEKHLYQLYEKFNDDSIDTRLDAPKSINDSIIVTSEANNSLKIPGKIGRIITDDRKNGADRFYVYTPL